MTDTDKRPDVERLAEAVYDILVEHPDAYPHPKEIATYLVAHGFGHQSDHVRAFADWYRKHWSEYNWEDGPPPAADHYLASLAEKGENDET